MFLGSFIPSFDSKSRRIALPKKIRDYLATSEIVLSFGFENCLFGFDTKTWENEAAKQLASPLTERRPRDIRRFVFANATIIKLDDQGRFVIPNNYLEYANLHKRPIVVGTGDHFEIWEEENWKEVLEKLKGQQT